MLSRKSEGAGRRRWRAAGIKMAAVALCLGVLGFFDSRPWSGTLDAGGRWDEAFFRGYGPFDPDGFRLAGPRSEMVIGGFAAETSALVALATSSALPKAQQLSVVANGRLVHRQDVGGRYGVLTFPVTADAHGVIALRLLGDPADRGAFRVTWVRFEQSQRGAVPIQRWLWYVALLGTAMAAGLCFGGGRSWLGLVSLTTATACALAGLWLGRLWTLAYLPHLATVLLAAGLLAGACRLLEVDTPAVAWLSLAFACRTLLGTLPLFPSIDLAFHSHNIERFQEGQTIASTVSDSRGSPIPIPYPPALYAALAPFVAFRDTAGGEALLRWGMAMLEGTAPLLVFGVTRALGAGSRPASLAAAAYAVMPEPTLVLAKGIAANTFGAWVSLALILALARAWPGPLLAALSGVAFLAHPGSAAALGGLLALWSLVEWRSRDRQPRMSFRSALWVCGGLAVAAVTYYLDVFALTVSGLRHWVSGAADPGGVLFIRWVHLGKIAQDLVFKFGACVPLAVVGLRSKLLPGALGRLLLAWLGGASVLGVLAILSPFALRFEYFALPAVAAAAGVGAHHLLENRRAWIVSLLLAVSLAVQVGLGLLLLYGRFDPINVIIPSPRWPLVQGQRWPL